MDMFVWPVVGGISPIGKKHKKNPEAFLPPDSLSLKNIFTGLVYTIFANSFFMLTSPEIIPRSSPIATRFCSMVSRKRMVTV